MEDLNYLVTDFEEEVLHFYCDDFDFRIQES